jgi:hypothetical protein
MSKNDLQDEINKLKLTMAADSVYLEQMLLRALLTGMSLVMNPRDERSDLVNRVLRELNKRNFT